MVPLPLAAKGQTVFNFCQVNRARALFVQLESLPRYQQTDSPGSSHVPGSQFVLLRPHKHDIHICIQEHRLQRNNRCQMAWNLVPSDTASARPQRRRARTSRPRAPMAQGGGSAQKEYITVASLAFQCVLCVRQCACKLLSHRKRGYTGFMTDYPQSERGQTNEMTNAELPSLRSGPNVFDAAFPGRPV